jgi:stage V sporulation protein G
MDITEVRIFLRESEDKKLKAFATITFDDAFVVRNIKVIEGTKGLFVAMPSRKIKDPCPKCNFKNPARSRYCSQCATALPMPSQQPAVDKAQRQSEHRDIAHPITAECREMIQKKVLAAYEAERQKSPSDRAALEPGNYGSIDASDVDVD